jgi:hypothetical protein
MHIGNPFDSILLAEQEKHVNEQRNPKESKKSRTDVDSVSNQGVLGALDADNAEVGRARVNADPNLDVRAVRRQHPARHLQHILLHDIWSRVHRVVPAIARRELVKHSNSLGVGPL